MNSTKEIAERTHSKAVAKSHVPPMLAPALMIAFWILLGASSGIRLMESIWRLLDFQVGALSIVVPVGGVIGATAGALLGFVSNPRWQILVMAVFAGAAAGAVAGKLPWGDVGEVGGQVVGGLVGGAAWWTWMYIDRRRSGNSDSSRKIPSGDDEAPPL
jgi:hypothetical protein